MQVTFPSVAKPKEIGYNFSTDFRDDFRTSYDTGVNFGRWFNTHGDEVVQHSDNSVIGHHLLPDFCHSLLKYALANPQIVEGLVSVWPYIIEDKKIAFATMVVFVSVDKTRWYSLSEEKISTSEKKADSRKYEKICEWMDGSPKATYRLLVPNYGIPLLDRFLLTDAIIDYHLHAGLGYYGNATNLLSLDKDKFHCFEQVVHGLQSLVLSQDSARKNLENYTNNLAFKKRNESP